MLNNNERVMSVAQVFYRNFIVVIILTFLQWIQQFFLSTLTWNTNQWTFKPRLRHTSIFLFARRKFRIISWLRMRWNQKYCVYVLKVVDSEMISYIDLLKKTIIFYQWRFLFLPQLFIGTMTNINELRKYDETILIGVVELMIRAIWFFISDGRNWETDFQCFDNFWCNALFLFINRMIHVIDDASKPVRTYLKIE